MGEEIVESYVNSGNIFTFFFVLCKIHIVTNIQDYLARGIIFHIYAKTLSVSRHTKRTSHIATGRESRHELCPPRSTADQRDFGNKICISPFLLVSFDDTTQP